MKSLITLITILVLTLPSFGQTATQTVLSPNDSVECVPIDVMRSMIKDIIRGDECAQQIAILDSLLKIYETKFILLNDENSILRKKYASCEQSNQDYYVSNEFNLSLNKDLKTKNSRIKRQRNVLLGFTAILTAIVIKNIVDDNE